MTRDTLKAIGVPEERVDQVLEIVNTPIDKKKAKREALKRVLVTQPLKGAALGGAAGLGIQKGIPFADDLMSRPVEKGMKELSKSKNLGDMRKGPLFPVFSALGTAAYMSGKEMINYHRKKKQGYFD